jgi:hypothetical protein
MERPFCSMQPVCDFSVILDLGQCILLFYRLIFRRNDKNMEELIMHDVCSETLESGKQIVDKIRIMGFNVNPLAAELEIKCKNCDTQFQMTHMESNCPSCKMVYGVTPCHSHSAQFVKAAGINY